MYIHTSFRIPAFPQLLLLPLLALLFLGTCLPSDGSHGLLHPKSLAFLWSAGAFALSFFCRNRISFSSLVSLTLYCLFLTAVLLWGYVALFHQTTEISSTLDQGKLFILTGTVAFLIFWSTSEGGLPFPRLVKILLVANGTFSLLKASLFLLHAAGWVDMWSLMEQTGLRFMTMEMAGSMHRLQTSVDILTPYLLYFALQSSAFGVSLSKKGRAFYLLLAGFGLLMSFSRFLWMVAIVSIGLHFFSLSLFKKTKMVFLALFLGAAALFWIGEESFLSLLEIRLQSEANRDSDSVRSEQAEALQEEFLAYPMIGKGLGSYAPSCLREEEEALFHSYEVQWMAFLLQWGCMGVLILLAFLASIAFPLFLGPPTWQKISCLLLFALWILSGCTNPYLISLPSGIFYGLIASTGCFLRNFPQKDPLFSLRKPGERLAGIDGNIETNLASP